MRVLSICCGMGLLDRAFLDEGFEVVAGCEIDPDMRQLYEALNGQRVRTYDLKDLPAVIAGEHFDGIIGGPPCQAHSKTRTMREPRFGDLTPLVQDIIAAVRPSWYLLENVVPVAVEGARTVRLNAMHYAAPHQSRVRWFTYWNIEAPFPVYRGTVDTLKAYPGVVGKLYGAHRAAWLMGYPEATQLAATADQIVKGLANAVHYPLARAWAESKRKEG